MRRSKKAQWTLKPLFHRGWCQSWCRCSAKTGTRSEPAHISTGREQNLVRHQHVTTIAHYLLRKESGNVGNLPQSWQLLKMVAFKLCSGVEAPPNWHHRLPCSRPARFRGQFQNQDLGTGPGYFGVEKHSPVSNWAPAPAPAPVEKR